MIQKDTEELQANPDRVDSLMKLYEFCASGELRCYSQEVAMQKLSEEFELKRDKRMMEFLCKEILDNMK